MVVCLTINSCKENLASTSEQEIDKESVDFDWLVGLWQRTNDQEGRQTYENWEKINDSLYKGLGYTVVQKDTVWQEDMELVKEVDGNWSLNVSQNDQTGSTDFQLIKISDDSFTAENPENEFPTEISYRSMGERLQATISGGETQVDFEFEKRN